MNTLNTSSLFQAWDINLNEPLGLIFDVDELLCRNGGEIYLAYKMLLDKRGIVPKEGENFPGTDLFDIISNIKLRYNIDASVQDLVLERRNCYLNILNENDVKCCDGVKKLFQLLEKLKSQFDIRIAYATSSEGAFSKPLLSAIFRQCGLSSYIDNPNSYFFHADGRCVSTCWDANLKKKPAPDVYHATLNGLDLPIQQCIAFEDSLSGFQSAQSAGLRTVVVPSENREENFSSFTYDVVYENCIKLHSLMDFYHLVKNQYENKKIKAYFNEK